MTADRETTELAYRLVEIVATSGGDFGTNNPLLDHEVATAGKPTLQIMNALVDIAANLAIASGKLLGQDPRAVLEFVRGAHLQLLDERDTDG